MFLTRALSIRTPGRGQTMSFWNQVLKLRSPPEPYQHIFNIHSKVPSTAKNSNVSSNRAVETKKTVARASCGKGRPHSG